MNEQRKILGVLGGMGPYATLKFYELLLSLTLAEKDADHLRVILDVNPHIPSRSRCQLYGEESPVEGMIESCRKLEAYPVDMIALPCNSACAFLDEVQPHVRIPILNIVEIGVASLRARGITNGPVAVLGGAVTYRRQVYRDFLEKQGLSYIHHTEKEQAIVESLIGEIKLAKDLEAIRRKLIGLMETVQRKTGANAIILGCTEFACVGALPEKFMIIDSNRELARHCVALCQGSPAGPFAL